MKQNVTRMACAALMLMPISSTGLAQETRTTLCDLAKHGQAFSGQRVRLTVIYMSDLLEGSDLHDRRCPKVWLGPYESADPPDASVARFDDALRGRIGDLELRQFVVDVSGRFTWHGHDEPYGALEIQKVWSYTRIHGDWKKRRE